MPYYVGIINCKYVLWERYLFQKEKQKHKTNQPNQYH